MSQGRSVWQQTNRHNSGQVFINCKENKTSMDWFHKDIQIDWWHKDKHGYSHSTVFKLCAIDRKLNNMIFFTKEEFSSDICLSMHDTVIHGKSNFSSRELKCHKSERQGRLTDLIQYRTIALLRKMISIYRRNVSQCEIFVIQWEKREKVSSSLSFCFSMKRKNVFISHICNWWRKKKKEKDDQLVEDDKWTNWIDLHDAINSLEIYNRNKLSIGLQTVLTSLCFEDRFTQQQYPLKPSPTADLSPRRLLLSIIELHHTWQFNDKIRFIAGKDEDLFTSIW